MTGLRACRSHRSCKCSGDSELKQHALHAGSDSEPAGLARVPRAETSTPRNARVRCPRLYKRHPFRRHPVFRSLGSAKWSGRSRAEILGLELRQVNLLQLVVEDKAKVVKLP